MADTAALEALGIDAAEGLAYCADDPAFYDEMLAEYVNESEAQLAGMQRDFDRQDWANYRIRAHSLKNTSRMIGAAAVSDRAYALEKAAKEEDGPAIRAAHETFLSDYRALVEGLRRMIG